MLEMDFVCGVVWLGQQQRYESPEKRIKIELVIFDSTCYARNGCRRGEERRRHWCRSQCETWMSRCWRLCRVAAVTNFREIKSVLLYFMCVCDFKWEWRGSLEIFHSGEEKMKMKTLLFFLVEKASKWIGRRLMCLNFDFISPVYITYSDPIIMFHVTIHLLAPFSLSLRHLIKFKFSLAFPLFGAEALSCEEWREMLSCS